MAAAVPPQQVTAAQKLAQVNEQTWLTMGNLAEMMTDYDKAMNCYESALRHNPYSIIALSQIASLCRGREQFGRAVDYFKRILAIQENNGETWAALGHCYLMMDNLQEAYQAYQQALYHLSNPKDPKLWYGIGILYDRYGSLEHAEEAFSAVMKMDPKFEKANEIYFRLGIIYKQQQKYDLSLQCFRYILHNPPRPLTESDIWFQTGHVYEQQKEYELAKEAYERVLAENPDHAKVLQQLGWLYHQQNTSFCNQGLAIQYLTRSLKSDSNDAQSWYLLGRCYMAEQNYNKAYEAYQQAVYRDARNPTFWCSIGVLYYQINQYRDALDAYSRAIRLNPYISEVWYDLGTLYESCNNQVQDALDAYQRAAELDPNNPHIKQRLELLRKSQSVQSQPGSAPVPQDVSNPSQYQTGGHNGQPPLTGGGASYSQSAPSGPPSSMSAYHTAVDRNGSANHPSSGNNHGPSRPNDERVATPQLPVVNHGMNAHENNNGPTRDLPMPGPPPSNGSGGRRSPGAYGSPFQHHPHAQQQQQQQQQGPSAQPNHQQQHSGHPQHQGPPHPREDVRIPDIGRGGGRAPTPSDRSQMNPIMSGMGMPPPGPQPSEPPSHHHAHQQQPPHHQMPPPLSHQHTQQQQQTSPSAKEGSGNLPPMSMRYNPKDEAPQQQHRYSHDGGYRGYEQGPPPPPLSSAATHSSQPRPMDADYSNRVKHEETSSSKSPYHSSPHASPAQPHHSQAHTSSPISQQASQSASHQQSPRPYQHQQPISGSSPSQPSTTGQQQQQENSNNYDETAADALLSMGNPHLGQKRAAAPTHLEGEEHKKPRGEDSHPNRMDIDQPTATSPAAAHRPQSPARTAPSQQQQQQQDEVKEEIKDKEDTDVQRQRTLTPMDTDEDAARHPQDSTADENIEEGEHVEEPTPSTTKEDTNTMTATDNVHPPSQLSNGSVTEAASASSTASPVANTATTSTTTTSHEPSSSTISQSESTTATTSAPTDETENKTTTSSNNATETEKKKEEPEEGEVEEQEEGEVKDDEDDHKATAPTAAVAATDAASVAASQTNQKEAGEAN